MRIRKRLVRCIVVGIALVGTACLSLSQGIAPRANETKSPLRWAGSLVPKSAPLPPVPATLPTADQVWTINLALARALEANPDVQAALTNVQRQDGLRLQSAALMLPRVSLSASTNRRDDTLVDRSGFELGLPPSSRTAVAARSYDVTMELRQTIFDGLGSWNQLKRSVLLKKKASLDARDVYLRVASQVRQAFDAILLRQAVVRTRADAARDLARLAEVAQKRFGVGEISEFESLRAQSALRSAEADLAQAGSDLAEAEEIWCRMLFINRPADGLKLMGKVEPVDYRETFDAALARARANRLDVRSAELQLDAAKMGQRMAGAGFLPRIEAFADYGYRSSYYDVNQQLEGWTVGVAGHWDIFDSGQTLGAMRVQRADRRIAEIRLAESRGLVASQVHQLFGALDQSKIVMAAHASARDLGERSVREARQLYAVGRVSLEEILNAELAYRQALLGWLGSVFTYNTTVYQLDYATTNETFLDDVAKKP